MRAGARQGRSWCARPCKQMDGYQLLILILATRMISANFAVSDLSIAANCSGFRKKGSTPWLSSFSLTSDMSRIRAISPASLSMTARGVPAGVRPDGVNAPGAARKIGERGRSAMRHVDDAAGTDGLLDPGGSAIRVGGAHLRGVARCRLPC